MTEPWRPARAGRPSTFAAMRSRDYRWLWGSATIMFAAVNAQTVARGWLARELTGTNAGLGGVLLAFGIAMLVTTPLAGVAADRLAKRSVLVVSMSMLALTSLWLGLAVAFGVAAYWMLVLMGAVQAVGFALYAPARIAFISDLVAREDLTNALTLAQMSAEATRVAGPALAGALIATSVYGTEATFLICAVLGAIAVVGTLRLPPGRPRGAPSTRSAWHDITDAVGYVRHQHALAVLLVASLGVVMIGMPYMAFLPLLADGVFDGGSLGFGLMAAAAAMGALVTGTVFAGRRSRDPWRRVSVSGLAFGGLLVAISLAPTFGTAIVGLLLLGGAGLLFQTTNLAILLDLSALEYHGRMQALVMLGYSAFGLVALPFGALADQVGLRMMLRLMGLGVVAVIGVFAWSTRRYRRGLPHDETTIVDLG